MNTSLVEQAPYIDDDFEPARWRPYVAMVISLAGFGISIYLTLAHYTTIVSLSCPLSSAVINCEKVTTSPQSYIFHIPVAVLGLAYFIPMLVLSTPMMWRSSIRLIAMARLALSTIGIAIVIYLVHAELFEIHAICIWCTTVHVLTLLMFIVVATGWQDATAYWEVPADDEQPE